MWGLTLAAPGSFLAHTACNGGYEFNPCTSPAIFCSPRESTNAITCYHTVEKVLGVTYTVNKGILERLGQRYYLVDTGLLPELVQWIVDMQCVVVTQ